MKTGQMSNPITCERMMQGENEQEKTLNTGKKKPRLQLESDQYRTSF